MSIEKLKAAYKAATPGEWDWHLGTSVEQDDLATVELHPKYAPEDVVVMLQGGGEQAANVEFIALVHNLMPQLLDALYLVQSVAYGNTEFDVLEECANGILAAIEENGE